MKVIATGAMREVDRAAASQWGLATLALMESAGCAVARRAVAMLGGSVAGRRVAIVVGTGNNGGDGLVVARRLANAGAGVKVLLAAEGGVEAPRLSPDGAVQYGIVCRMGMPVTLVDDAHEEEVSRSLQDADLVVDAVLGTGARSAPRGHAALGIEWMRRFARRVLAVDIPSGVDAETGKVYEPAVRAEETVTFGLPKPGQVLLPGARMCGRLWVDDIGFPAPLLEGAQAAFELVEADDVRALLPQRPADAHKGSFGHVLVVAGSRGMAGAGAMAARSAIGAGAGLVTWAVPQAIQDTAATMVPEALTAALPEVGPGIPGGHEAASRVLDMLASRDVLLLGPGLGTHPGTGEMVSSILSRWEGPAVIDADALRVFAAAGPVDGPPWGTRARENGALPRWVLTPHPGEMARLVGRSVAEVQADRVHVAADVAARWGSVVVLKGARSVVAEPAGAVRVSPAATAALATGGSGDVLAGVIAALLAQGVPAPGAAVAGVFAHALAACLAAEGGDLAAPSGAIAAMVGGALRRLKRGEPLPDALMAVRRLD